MRYILILSKGQNQNGHEEKLCNFIHIPIYNNNNSCWVFYKHQIL